MPPADHGGLLAHMEWADALTWKTVSGFDAAREDAQIADKLYHLLEDPAFGGEIARKYIFWGTLEPFLSDEIFPFLEKQP